MRRTLFGTVLYSALYVCDDDEVGDFLIRLPEICAFMKA